MNLHLKENFTKMSEKAGKFRIHSTNAVKKTVIATLVVSTISINTAFANPDNTPKLQTIYHVYINNDYLGTVSNKDMVENLITTKLSEAEEEYKDFDLQYKTKEVVFVPEQIFPNNNLTLETDQDVLDEVNNSYEVAVEAVALKIDGEIVTYLENEEKIAEVIEKLKLKYVSKKDLAKLEELKEKKTNLPKLKKGESRLLDVHLSKNVTISLEEISPELVKPTKDVIKLLQKGTLEEKKYKVKEGDVLGAIAQKHGLKLKQLLELNPNIDENTLLQIGDELNVTAYEPYIDIITKKEVYQEEKVAYKVKIVEDASMWKGETKVVQNGKEGKKAITYQISEQNGKVIKKKKINEKVLSKPVTKIVHKGTKVVPSRGTGSMLWPTYGGYVSSYQGYRWGRFHKGIDIARPSNYNIRASDNGVVVFAGWDGTYGNKIIIDHRNGLRTVYAHLSSINVNVGQTVARGSTIGVMGSTGNSTGIHLHFEVYKNGRLQNPSDYVRR
ncbi:M23 family metallopeptidase [Bacillus kwashiorkori]|uniref:M23 family metallopeptidase n=1 Tax=Bacillus kwashiorkori TaxID=1522318 RepID=UPI0007864776|nr:M23 family metallopeptidase [Bacillus kwashiorkori]